MANAFRDIKKDNLFNNLLAIVPTIVAVFFIYYFSLSNNFINWDDDVYVTNNPLIQSLSFNNLRDIFTQPISSNYHPLTVLSLAFDYHFFELNPFYYHAHNLVLHLLNVLLVFIFIYWLTKGNLLAAVFTATIFGVHPLHVESVAWVSERKDLLYSFWFLLGLAVYAKNHSNKSFVKIVFIFLSFTFSVLTKSAAVVFPLVLLLVDYYLDGKISKKGFIEKVPFLLVSIVIGVIAINTQHDALAGNFKYPFADRISFASYGLLLYVVKFFAPVGLNNLYLLPFPVPKFFGFFVLSVIPLLVFLIVRFIKKPQNRFYFGFWFFFLTIVLALQVLTVGNALISERYTYIPYIGFAYAFFFLIEKVIDRLGNRIPRITVLLVFILGATVAFSFASRKRLKVWENGEKLWEDAIKKNPENFIAYNNLGNYYFRLDSMELAFYNFSKSLQLKPNYSIARFNRGLIYFNQKDYNSAISDFDIAIEVKPGYKKAVDYRDQCYLALGEIENLTGNSNKDRITESFNEMHAQIGVAFYKRREYQKAIDEFDKAISIDKNENAEIYLNIGLCYLNLKREAESIPYFSTCLKKAPTNSKAAYNRGVAFFKMGEFDKALNDFTKTIALDPQRVDARKYRANIYMKKKEYKKVADDYSAILAVEKNNAAAYFNRAAALYYTGDYKQAYNDATRAIELGYKVESGFYNKLKSRAQ